MFNLMPRDEKFYDELEGLADRVVNTSRQFETMAVRFPETDGQMQSIEGDRLGAARTMTESLVRLDQAFITPLDREDILNLLTEMYGVVDRVAELSQRFRLYEIKDLHPTLTGQARNLSTISKALSDVIHSLRHEKK